ncbi:MAG: Maf family protein [Ignisphaera sp.]|nr:Maf family protein [Ignisphaera sp.]MCX8168232.1 Maf family protein [Ignisphaera sp.]MDW8084899.1 Maf family protein [Ignisphaera sp.]
MIIKKYIVLASSSLRRVEIFRKMGIDVIVIVPKVEEVIYNDDPFKTVLENSRRKILSVVDKSPQTSIIIGADTVVFNPMIGVVGKPKTIEEAKRMLMSFSGRYHMVISGVALLDREAGKSKEFTDITIVKFRDITEDEVELYINIEKPFDKAGGYSIQGLACFFIESIMGDYYNVVGLPLSKLYTILSREFGLNLLKILVEKKDH